jgi:hypothetical protein
MDYSNSQIFVNNLPPLESIGNGLCCRKYCYQFNNLLPDIDEMNLSIEKLNRKFTFTKEAYDLTEDFDVFVWVMIERLSDREAIFTVSTNEPEECCVVVYGGSSLPNKIEQIFGVVELIQGDLREHWIR